MNHFAKLSIALAVSTGLMSSAMAVPQTYTVDPTHTFPRFSYSHFGLSKQLSRFDKTSGTVVWDKEAKTASIDMTINTSSVDTGFPLFNEHIQGADFLDTVKYPTATFKSTKVVFDGDKPTSIEGNLTIKGVTKPVTLKVTSFLNMPHPMLKKDAIGANAEVVVKRSDFKMDKYVPYVGDDVTIDIALEAINSK